MDFNLLGHFPAFITPPLLLLLVILGSRAYTLSHPISPFSFFVMGFFKIGSHDLFAWAGFKL
jgi:hypothetical protein